MRRRREAECRWSTQTKYNKPEPTYKRLFQRSRQYCRCVSHVTGTSDVDRDSIYPEVPFCVLGKD